jgi:Glycoside hydrolase family 44
MKLDHDPDENVYPAHRRKSEEGEDTEPALKRMNIKARPDQSVRLSRPIIKRHRSMRIVSMILITLLIVVLVRVIIDVSAADNELLVRIGNQGTGTVDLRQSLPISPYLSGANVFPEFTINSADQANGFMDYSSAITDGLRNAHIRLLRFPGGGWGEEHILSYDQLNAFSTLLSKSVAVGMVQARLSGPVGNSPYNLASLLDRANLAGRWVDYMNNPHSEQRTGNYAHAPFHPIKLWTVGNEPDLLVNPDTGKPFTAAEYANAFIQFSLAMHEADPTIQVFGPEISQFNGVGEGPKDSNGQLWMDTFLKSVGAYEKAHPNLGFHLLDGVSFHSYPLIDATKAPSILLSSTDEWNYQLPPLRQLILQDFGRDVPIAVTEINSNPTANVPSPGVAALWWADTLGTLMNQGVAYVAFFSAEGVDTPYPLFTTNGLHQTSMLRVMQLFSHLQNNLIPVAMQHDPVSLYATLDDTHQMVSLLFVNKSPVTQLAQVSAQDQFLSTGHWHDMNISLSGYSITLVTLHRDGGAEAYSYDVPTDENSAVGQLKSTVCGKTSDVLANDTPC